MPFQLVFLPNACEVYSRNIYIPTSAVMTNNDTTLTLHRKFLGFNLACMNITDNQFMQYLNLTKLSLNN